MGQLQPPTVADTDVSFPAAHVLLVTINRPRKHNSITHGMNWQLASLWQWYDDEPSLRVAVLTGAGDKAFCAGSDLIEIEEAHQAKVAGAGSAEELAMHTHPDAGFGGFSRRRGKKPVLAAVNGLALGGGFEMVLNW